MSYPTDSDNVQEYYLPLGGDSFDGETDERLVGDNEDIDTEIEAGDIIYYFNKSGNKKWRLSLATSEPYDTGDTSKDYGKRKERGFSQTKKDWKNVEAYFYVFLQTGGQRTATEREFFIGMGGGKADGKCTNFMYRIEIGYSGRYRFAKAQTPDRIVYMNPDTGQVGGAAVGWANSGRTTVGTLVNNWKGLKFDCVNKTIDNLECRVLTFLCDRNNDNRWKQIAQYVDKGGWGQDMRVCKADRADEIGTWGGPLVTFGANELKDGKKGFLYKLISARNVDPLAHFTDPAPGQGGVPQPIPLPPSGKVYRDFGFSWNVNVTADACGTPGVPELTKVYDVPANPDAPTSHSDLNDRRTRCCIKCCVPESLLAGIKPKRIRWKIRKNANGSPFGPISCVLRKGKDDSVAVTYEIKELGYGIPYSPPPLDASNLTTTDQWVMFENLDANYTMVAGDRICIEFSQGSDIAEVEVARDATDPFDGSNTCAIKYEEGGIPPTAYGPDDLGRDFLGEIWI
ncbi:MAG TPA: hypothetical protein VGE97_03540 [Nitrososphaera sp.]|jgi:hypothetical protein